MRTAWIVALAIVVPAQAIAVSCGLEHRFEQRVEGSEGSRRSSTVLSDSNDGPGRSIFFFASHLNINTDGAPNSYHPMGREHGASNTICNGASAEFIDGNGRVVRRHLGHATDRELQGLSRDERRSLARRKCNELIGHIEAARQAGWVNANPRINFFAVATRDGRTPCIQSRGRFAGFYTSKVAYEFPSIADPCDPARYLSSFEFPAIVLPRRANRNFAIRPEDIGALAVVHYHGRFVYAVLGDTGPTDKLGEGTQFLRWELTNTPESDRDIRSIQAIAGPVHYLVLRRSNLRGRSLADVRSMGSAAFIAWGGEARYRACIAEVNRLNRPATGRR